MTRHRLRSPPMKSIRRAYEERGADSFYHEEGHLYRNPHLLQIKALLSRYADLISMSCVLDLCCGSGEVTRVARTLKVAEIVGVDPYTYEAYERRYY